MSETESADAATADPLGQIGADDAGATLESDENETPHDAAIDAEPDDTEPDTFSREYVTDLRQEAAGHRARANAAEERADTLAQSLWAERVSALNLLADPADLPFDADTLADPAEIRRQAEELLARRPHLRTRRITARAGQGEGNGAADSVSLTGIMRQRA